MPSRSGRQGAFVSPYRVNVSFGDGAGALASNPAADWFGPLSPIKPQAPPQIASRQWDYPSGFNLNTTPRVDAPITFATLRGLADGYDLLRLIIETRKDQVARMSWTIKPRTPTAAATATNDVARITSFLKHPDGVHNFGDWLRILLEDLFVLDAPALYMRRNRGGALIGLPPLDGATIKPVIDDWGRTPQPYAANGALVYPTAYQQILKGYPAVDYSVRDLIYRPRNVRVNRAYGYGPVEQILTTVNIALRKQIFTLEYYTSGNIPDSLIGVPDTWTPDQIASYQTYWDAYIEGDLGRRRKAKFVPGGMSKTFIQTKEPELKSDFDEWLARICCFAFSISPQAFVKQMNRSSAETQKDLAEEEGLAPVLNWIKHLIDDVIATEFNAPDLEFAWACASVLDPNQQQAMLSGYVSSGILTLNEARAQLGRDPSSDPAADRLMALTANGYQPIGAAHAGVEKYSPDQPRVPAGQTGGGQWTDGAGGAPAIALAPAPKLITGRSVAVDAAPSQKPANAGIRSLLDDGVYRPGADGTPKLTPVQEEEPEETEPAEGERTPEQKEILDDLGQQAKEAIEAAQELDPNWRPPDQLIGTNPQGEPSFDAESKLLREIIAAAEERIAQSSSQPEEVCVEPTLDRSNMEDKLKGYALNEKNDDNRGKAAWFQQVLGFDQSNWQELADQIYFDENIATLRGTNLQGIKYEEILPIKGANGRIANVTFGFIKYWSGVVGLTTAYAGPK
jgi:hypothetical protein